ncbi:MAG: bactofilin family protein [Phycisphaerae bacterium]
MSDGIVNGVEKTVISAATVIKGEICFAGPAMVCGRVEGQIRAEAELEITAEGSVEGDIVGAVVDIQGTVKGKVTASQTTRLGARAKLIGELRAANLAISEGATFVGKVCVGESAAQQKSEKTVVAAGAGLAAGRMVDPAAALQSRLASLQQAGAGEEEGGEEEGSIRIVPGAISAQKRSAVIVKAAH